MSKLVTGETLDGEVVELSLWTLLVVEQVPVLRRPEVSGHLRTAPACGEQNAMDFSQEANRGRQTFAEQP